MKKILSTLLLAVFISSASFAGIKENDNAKENKSNSTEQISSTVNLSGTIFDQNNNEALAGATIVIDGVKYYSDLDGNFTLNSLSSGKHNILVEMISYNNREMTVDVQNDTNLKIQLQQQ